MRGDKDSDETSGHDMKDKKEKDGKRNVMYMAAYVVLAIFLCFMVMRLFFTNELSSQLQGITGKAAGEIGCCEDYCTETDSLGCKGKFDPNVRCSKVEGCLAGCCIEKENYCQDNFLKGRCENLGYQFIEKDCSEITKCINPQSVSKAMENTGIVLEYSPMLGEQLEGIDPRYQNFGDTWDYGRVEPYAGYKGSFFKIMYVIADFNSTMKVEAVLSDDNGQLSRLNLFDDGQHMDAGEKDGIYGNVWDSSQLSFKGLKKVTLSVYVTPKSGSQVTKNNVFEFMVISDVKCMPLKILSSGESQRNIIYLGNGYDGIERLKEDVEKSFDQMSRIRPFSGASGNLSYYIIEKQYNFASDTDTLNSIMAECSFFNNSRDTAIILDSNEVRCRRVSEEVGNIFTLSPSFTFLSDNTDTIGEALGNICLVAKTFSEFAEAVGKPPEITLLTQGDRTFWNNYADIRFSITDDKDEEMPYTIIAGDSTLSGTAKKGQVVDSSITLGDGMHAISVTASDSDGNTVESDKINVMVDSSLNYLINIGSPINDEIINASRISLSFNITNNDAMNATYEVFLDDVQKDLGILNIGEGKSTAIINLAPGRHILFIEATDDKGRKAYSKKISFEIRLS